MTDRELLEQQASESVSAELFYDLADNMDITTDSELLELIHEGIK